MEIKRTQIFIYPEDSDHTEVIYVIYPFKQPYPGANCPSCGHHILTSMKIGEIITHQCGIKLKLEERPKKSKSQSNIKKAKQRLK